MIDLTISQDQADLTMAVRDAAGAEFPRVELVRAAVEGAASPFDTARWQRLAELGLFGLAATEESGGLGLGLAEEVLVILELGRIPASGPLIGTMLAVRVAAAAGNVELARELIEGRARAGLITGGYLVDAGRGDYGLAVDEQGAELLFVTEVSPITSFDESVPAGRLNMGTSVVRVSDGRLQARLRTLVSAYLVGVAEAATQMSATYAQTREQFGKPIGSFQAVKHRCAEMVIRAYSAKAELLVAALLLDREDPHSGRLEAAAAYLLSLQAARRNTEDNVQNHGGIGITAEHDAGVLVKRAHIYSNLAGSEGDVVPVLLSAPRTQLN